MGRHGWVGAIVCGTVVASPIALTGQDGVTFGPRVGVVVSTMTFEDHATESQTRALPGLQVGASVRADLGRWLSTELGVHLSREGFGGGGAHTGDLERDHVVLPALLSVRTPTRVSMRVSAGAAAKVALRCRQTSVPGVGTVACDDDVMGASWNRMDLTGLAGLGVSAPWGGRVVATDLLVSWGLRDLNGGLFIPGWVRSVSVGLSVAVLSRGWPWARGGDR